jgi:hypothetical protein
MVRKTKKRNISSFDGEFEFSESRGKKDQCCRFSLKINAVPKNSGIFDLIEESWFFFQGELQ